MKPVRKELLAIAMAAGMITCNTSEITAQSFYQGKQVTLLVGPAAGGGIDTIARLFARTFSQKIEGAPTLIVQNMLGAGGAVALGHLAQRAPKDGTVLIYDVWLPLVQITRPSQVRFDYTTLSFVGAVRGGPWVVFARKDIVPGGMKQPADIAKAGALVYAGQQPSLVLDIYGRLGLNLLKLKHKYVSGYPGAQQIRVAIERDEANVTTHGLQGYRSGVEPTLVKNGVVMPVWYFQRRDANGAYVASPLVPEMTSFLDLYRQIHGTGPSGFEWEAFELLNDLYGNASNFVWGPPGMEPAALPPLQKAFAATLLDPEFIAEQKRMFGLVYENVTSEEAKAIIARIGSVDPKMVEFFVKLMQ